MQEFHNLFQGDDETSLVYSKQLPHPFEERISLFVPERTRKPAESARPGGFEHLLSGYPGRLEFGVIEELSYEVLRAQVAAIDQRGMEQVKPTMARTCAQVAGGSPSKSALKRRLFRLVDPVKIIR